MKLKAQIKDEIIYTIKRKKQPNLSQAERFYYSGIRDALEWVLGTRKEATHTDSSPFDLNENINDEE